MGLSPRTRKLLDAYREEESLSSVQSESLLGELSARIASGAMPSVHVDPVVLKGAWTHTLWSKLPWILSGLSGIGVLGAAWLYTDTQQASVRSEPPASVTAPTEPSERHDGVESAPVVVLASDDSLQVDSGAQSAPVVAAARRKATRARGPSKASAAPPPVAEQHSAPEGIEAEFALIERAHSLLRAKRPHEALQVLDEHRASFPQGKLSDSRAYARVLALCAMGEHAAAQAVAARFARDFANSPFAARVKAACPSP